ncbi:HAMP domain-containing histidine kinase [Cohnella xylanilytica]|uniref:histidine kinase n=1 Tax=Cohnella xylanilytica TaxID=557555 RepID=A0A841TVJ0_9BACL|nr:HAMP domain-containing histidine kinase [Cohnella xylanilytica]
MSIRLRLTLWYSGLLAVTLVAFGFLVYYVVYHNTMQDVRHKLRSEADNMGYDFNIGNFTQTPLTLRESGELGRDQMGAQLILYTQDGKGVMGDQTSFLLQNNIQFPYPDQKHARDRFVKYKVNGHPFYVLEQSLYLRGSDKVVALLQIAAYTYKEETLFSQLRTILLLTGAAGLLVAFLLGLFLSRKALRPIEQVTEAAERIQSGVDLSIRIPGNSQDEIGRLRSTLNHMLERIERAYNGLEETNIAQRRFVSDASHELRTPLTTIRGNVDFLEKIWADSGRQSGGAEDAESAGASGRALTIAERESMSKEAIHDIADEARRMSRLVNDLLSLARADAGYVMDMERVELKSLAEEAARRAAFLPRTAEWKLGSLDALDGVWVKGNRDYLLQLLFIFIENGFKYTPSGEVRLESVRADDKVGLIVSDTGIGMSREEVPHIFDRFYRVDVSRGQTPGTGLGLSIAKWIADMHNASLEVRTKLGEGSRFIVWLPIDFSEPPECDIIEGTVRPELPNRET